MLKESKEVFFILEAGGLVGLGHLNRCIALASKLKLYNNVKISFLMVSQNEFSLDYSHFFYKKLDDALIKAKQLKNTKIVLDTYNLSVKEIEQLNSSNNEIYLIDDLVFRQPIGVSIINPSLLDNTHRFDLPQDKVISGNRYILLRDGIRKRQRPNANSNVFLYLGGVIEFSKVNNLVKILATQFPNLNINLIITTNISVREKQSLINLASTIKLHKNLESEEISNLIELCAFGIIAAGQIIHEFIYLSKPFIAIYTASNQENNVIALKKIQNELIVIELVQIEQKIVDGIFKMLNSQFRQKIIESFEDIIDGRGSQRVADFIMDKHND